MHICTYHIKYTHYIAYTHIHVFVSTGFDDFTPRICQCAVARPNRSPVRQRTKYNAKPRNSHEVLMIVLRLCSTNNVGSMHCDGLHSLSRLAFQDNPSLSKLPRLAQCGVPFRRADAQVLEGDPRQARCRANL